MTPEIRWMVRRDLAPVLVIEQASFEFPWTDDDFIKHLRRSNCIGMVATIDDQVVGYMVYELHKTRYHLLNFAVDPTCQRQGIASAMVAKLSSKTNVKRRCKITLNIRETNLPGLLFFRSQGFRAVAMLRGYCEGEDGIEMEWKKVDIVAVGNRVAKFLKG